MSWKIHNEIIKGDDSYIISLLFKFYHESFAISIIIKDHKWKSDIVKFLSTVECMAS